MSETFLLGLRNYPLSKVLYDILFIWFYGSSHVLSG